LEIRKPNAHRRLEKRNDNTEGACVRVQEW